MNILDARNNLSKIVAAAASGTEAARMAPGDDPGQAWSVAYQRMGALTEDPDMLAPTVNGPTGPVPLEQALGSLVSMDTHVHTWDLARAVGGDERLDPGVSHMAFEMLQPMDAMIRQPGVFGPKLDPPAVALNDPGSAPPVGAGVSQVPPESVVASRE